MREEGPGQKLGKEREQPARDMGLGAGFGTGSLVQLLVTRDLRRVCHKGDASSVNPESRFCRASQCLEELPVTLCYFESHH